MTKYFRDDLYQFLIGHIKQYDTSPSYSDMTKAMGISPKSKSLITRNLRTLEKENKIILQREGRRILISLVDKQVSLLGHISTGLPIETISQYSIDINHLFQGSNRFALQVKGTSMVDEGIRDGDIIICKKSNTAVEGDIAVVLIDHHYATLKRISYKMNGLITLIPDNPKLKPRAYLPERIYIQGIYIGLIRTQI